MDLTEFTKALIKLGFYNHSLGQHKMFERGDHRIVVIDGSVSVLLSHGAVLCECKLEDVCQSDDKKFVIAGDMAIGKDYVMDKRLFMAETIKGRLLADGFIENIPWTFCLYGDEQRRVTLNITYGAFSYAVDNIYKFVSVSYMNDLLSLHEGMVYYDKRIMRLERRNDGLYSIDGTGQLVAIVGNELVKAEPLVEYQAFGDGSFGFCTKMPLCESHIVEFLGKKGTFYEVSKAGRVYPITRSEFLVLADPYVINSIKDEYGNVIANIPLSLSYIKDGALKLLKV